VRDVSYQTLNPGHWKKPLSATDCPTALWQAPSFMNAKRFKDIIAYLRYIHNPDDQRQPYADYQCSRPRDRPADLAELSNWAKSLGLTETGLLKLLVDIKTEHSPFNSRITQSLVSFARMIENFESEKHGFKLDGFL